MSNRLKIWLARHWLPAGLRWRGMRLAYMRMLGHLATDADEPARARIAESASKLGEDLATDLRTEFGMTGTLDDADAAWAIGCQAFGLTYERTVEPNKITYDHTGCALWQFYKHQGQCHCETVCLPMVTSMTASLAPGVTMTIERAPTLERGCRKSLKQ